MSNKQSSIEYLIEQLKLHGYLGLYIEEEYIQAHQKIFDDIIQKTKELHKEEIIKSWMATDNELQRLEAEKYYNQTFNNEN